MMEAIAHQKAGSQEASAKQADRWLRWFVLSAGGIFLVTGLAKIVTSFGHARALSLQDPLLLYQFRHLLLAVGVTETVIAVSCFFVNKPRLALGLIAWMSTNFAVYRTALWFIGWHRPCHCMGNLTDMLHLSPERADLAMKLILTYLVVGSYVMLFLGPKASPTFAFDKIS